MARHGSAFHMDASRENVITRADFFAGDKKRGMDLMEMKKAIAALEAQPTVSRKGYTVNVAIGFRGQVQRITFEEVQDVPATS